MPVSWLWFGAPLAGAEELPLPSPVTRTELEWMVREVAPLVEDVAGRSFTSLPAVVMASGDDIRAVLRAEQAHLLAARGATAEQLAAIEPTTAPFAGKYGFLDGRLYVAVDALEESLAFNDVEPWLLRPVLRLVVAHELAHALADQQVDLDALVAGAASQDAVMAMNCLYEGHAVWVHEQVGVEAGLQDAVVVLSELLGARDPVRRRMDPQSFHQRYVYGFGREFVAWHARRGGLDAVWRVMEAPPAATSMIVAPQTWNLRVAEVDVLARTAMQRASKRLADKDWKPVAQVMGDFDVRDQLVRAGGNPRIADDLDAGWNSRLVGGAMAGVEVQVLQFRSEDGARAFVDDMLHQAEFQELMVGDVPFLEADAGAFDRVSGDASAREAIRSTVFGTVDHLGRIWVARGTDVVQVVLVNAPATDREVAAAIERVFRVLDRRGR